MSRITDSQKRIVALVGTAAVVLLALVLAGRGGRSTQEDSVEACIEAMFDAMQRGDVEQYLSCFSPELQQRLRAEFGGAGTDGFAAYLKSQVEELKGWAIRRDMTENLPDGAVRIVVERIYAGRQWERQGYRVKRTGGRWQIYHIEPAELFEPPVPYGTPAFPDAAPPKIEQPVEPREKGPTQTP